MYEILQSSAFGQKMVCNAVNNARLNTIAMGTCSPSKLTLLTTFSRVNGVSRLIYFNI